MLSAKHRVTWDSAQVSDLAQTLHDRVLLCQLLNNVWVHSINLKEIDLRLQMSQVLPRDTGRCVFASVQIVTTCQSTKSSYSVDGEHL